MRKDSILQNFYNSKLHKAEKGEEVRNVNEPYHPITNPDGYKGKVSLNRIMSDAKKIPAKLPYKPNQLVNDVKAGLSAFSAGSSMGSSPLAQGVNFLTRLANSTGDAYTATRYAMDGQWGNAAMDAAEAIVDFLPYRKGTRQGINLSKTNPNANLTFSTKDKLINKGIDAGRAAGATDDFRNSSIGKFLFGDPNSDVIKNKFGGLIKAKVGMQIGDPNQPYHPLTNPQGYKGNPPVIQAGPTVEAANLMKNRIALNQAKAQQQGPQLRVYDESKSRQGKKIYDEAMRLQAQANSDLSQTMGSFTPQQYADYTAPGGAGSIGANTQLAATALPVLAGGIGAAAPYIGPALQTAIAGVPGLTAGNIINAGFAYQGAKNLPNVYNAWKNVVNKPTLSNIGNAAGETAVTGLDMLPFLHGASKGIPSVIGDVKQAGRWFGETPNPNWLKAAEEAHFNPATIEKYNPATQMYDQHAVDIPSHIVPGRPFADIQHKLPSLRKDLGIGPVQNFLNKRFPGLAREIPLDQGKGMLIDPETGKLFDSNTRYWLNRQYGNTPSIGSVLEQRAGSLATDANKIGSTAKPQFTKAITYNNQSGITPPIADESRLGNSIYNLNNAFSSPTIKDHLIGLGMGINDIGRGRPFFQTFPMTEAQKLKISGRQDKAWAKGLDFSKKWHYGTGNELRPEVNERIENFLPTLKGWQTNNLDYNAVGNPMAEANNQLVNSRINQLFDNPNILTDTKGYIANNRGRIGGVNMTGNNIDVPTLRNHGIYYRTPRDVLNTGIHEDAHSAQKLGFKTPTVPWGEKWSDELASVTPDGLYYEANPNTALGKEFRDAMVDAVPGTKTWEASPKELHSETMVGRNTVVQDLKNQGYSEEEAIQALQNPSDEHLDEIIKQGRLYRFFKPKTSDETIRKLVKLLPGVIGTGVIGVDLNRKKFGGITKFGPGGPILPGTLSRTVNDYYGADKDVPTTTFDENTTIYNMADEIAAGSRKTGSTANVSKNNYTGASIVDYLATKGYPTSKQFRKQLALDYDVSDYDFSGKKNLELLSKMKADESFLNDIEPTNEPISAEKIMEMEKEVVKVKALPKKQPKNASQSILASITSLQFNSPISTPSTFLKNRMHHTPLHTMPDVPVEQGLNPTVLNMMLSTKRPMNQTKIVKVPNNPFGSITGGGGFKIAPPVVQAPVQAPGQAIAVWPYNQPQSVVQPPMGVDNRFRAYEQPSQEQPYIDQMFTGENIFEKNTETPTDMITQPATPPAIIKPITQQKGSAESNSIGFGDIFKMFMGDPSSTIKVGTKIAKLGDKLYNNETFQDAKSIFKEKGISGLWDAYQSKSVRDKKLQTGDDSTTVTNFTIPVISPNIKDSLPPPVVFGKSVIDTDRGDSNFYHAPMYIDLNRAKFGFKNREGKPSTEQNGITETAGLVLTPFAAEYSTKSKAKNSVGDDFLGTTSIRKYKDSEIKDNVIYGGIDDEGNFKLGYGRDMKGQNLTMADFRSIDTEGFVKDSKGKIKLGNETSNKKFAKVPHVKTDSGENHLPFLVPNAGKNQDKTFGQTTGGKIIISTPDFKEKILVGGSLADVDKAIEDFKTKHKIAKVKIIVLDNGTYSRGFMKKGNKISSKEWKEKYEINSSGGAGFYLRGRGYKMGGPVSYKEGGNIDFGTEMTVSAKQLAELKKQGYKIEML